MRFVACWLLVFAVSFAAAQAVGDPTPEPALLPPPPSSPATPSTTAPTTPAAPTPPVVPTTPPVTPPAGAATGASPAAAAPEESLPTPPSGDHPSNATGGATHPGAALLKGEPTWYERGLPIGPAPWDTGIELGINGSSGTSDSFSMRAGGYMKRESRFSKLDLSAYYNRTDSGGQITQNNAQFDVRNDWLLDDKSPWTLFAQNNIFYDEFKDFDIQTNLDTGIGYRFFHGKRSSSLAGWAAARRGNSAAPTERWVPEGLFG